MALTEEQIERYSRHLLLPQIGSAEQEKLFKSKVLVLGAGGLGSPLLLYLAAAGIGTLGIADADVVDLSNLQRQIIHKTESIGTLKTESAKEAIGSLNPDVKVVLHNHRLTVENIREVIRDYDVITDGSDNFPTRFLMGDACFFEKKPLVSASIFQFDGQISTFKEGYPCYRCLYGSPPSKGMSASCKEAGVIGTIGGIMGALQASEVIKELLGLGKTLAGQLLIFDALSTRFTKHKIPKVKDCALCGENRTITSLIACEQETCSIS